MKTAPVHSMVALLTALVWGCAGRGSSVVPGPPSTPAPSAPSPTPTPTPSGQGEDAGTKRGEGEREGAGEDTSGSKPETKGESAGATGAPGGAKTGDEKRAGLDGDLDESLREFDEILLREQEALEERHEASATASAGRGSSRGRETGTTGAGGESGLEEGREQAELGGTGGSPDRPPQDEPANGTGGSTVEPGTGDIPDDVGDGADDDIVARQLREAAMNEKDPELREKLWDEYRAYKAGLEK